MLYTSLEELDADDCSFAFIHWMLCSRHIHYYLVYIPCLRVLSTFLLFQFPLPNHKSRSPFPPPALVANDDLSCPQHVFDSCQTTPVAAVAEGASLLNMQGVLQQPFTWALQVRPGESSGTRACIDTLSRVLSILASVPTRHGCCASGNFHRNCDQEDDDTDELMDVWSLARAYCGATCTLFGSGGEEVLI